MSNTTNQTTLRPTGAKKRQYIKEFKEANLRAPVWNHLSYSSRIKEEIKKGEPYNNPDKSDIFEGQYINYHNPHEISYRGQNFLVVKNACFAGIFEGDSVDFVQNSEKTLTELDKSVTGNELADELRKKGRADVLSNLEEIFDTPLHAAGIDELRAGDFSLKIFVQNNRMILKQKVFDYFVKHIEDTTGGKINIRKVPRKTSYCLEDYSLEGKYYKKKYSFNYEAEFKAENFQNALALKLAVFSFRLLYEGPCPFYMAFIYDLKDLIEKEDLDPFAFYWIVRQLYPSVWQGPYNHGFPLGPTNVSKQAVKEWVSKSMYTNLGFKESEVSQILREFASYGKKERVAVMYNKIYRERTAKYGFGGCPYADCKKIVTEIYNNILK